jgi:1,4-alpha-glucan branching enzyme/maltooligosyltrehalose trehalohydrolase
MSQILHRFSMLPDVFDLQNATVLSVMKNIEPCRVGPVSKRDGSWSFQIHAPNADSLQLTHSNDGINWFTCEMNRGFDDLFYCQEHRIKPGGRYWYVLDGVHGVPDPWSRFQPDGPHGASQLIDENTYCWQKPCGPARPWHEAVLYELHIGAFTHEGTFAAAIDHLGHLSRLGITVLQVMPVWTRPCGASWGYDTNYLYSVDPSYGAPNDFKRFIDAAHDLGLQVLLDVVYNHLGIEGNYLGKFDGRFLASGNESLWGARLNFDRAGCHLARRMVIDNGLFWLEEFHLDGLRIDSPMTIDDGSKIHILEELALVIRDRFAGERMIHLLLENDHYAGRIRHENEQYLYNAALNIEGGELLFALAGAGDDLLDDEGLSKLFLSLAGGQEFYFSEAFPFVTAFARVLHNDRQIISLQNHDLIGNSQSMQRIWSQLGDDLAHLWLAITCLSPATPLLFMGDEFGCVQPFPFFCNFRDVNEQQVLQGRKRDFGIDPKLAGFMKPFSPETFEAAKIVWPDGHEIVGSQNYRLLKKLLATRRHYIEPLNRSSTVCDSRSTSCRQLHQANWDYHNGLRLNFQLNLGEGALDQDDATRVYCIEGDGWIARWWIEQL